VPILVPIMVPIVAPIRLQLLVPMMARMAYNSAYNSDRPIAAMFPFDQWMESVCHRWWWWIPRTHFKEVDGETAFKGGGLRKRIQWRLNSGYVLGLTGYVLQSADPS
jgi:hypothetical protein